MTHKGWRVVKPQHNQNQLVIRSPWFNPDQVRWHSFVKIDHELFTVILSLPLIQEEQLSVLMWKNVHKYWLTT